MTTKDFIVETEIGKDESGKAIMKSAQASYNHLDSIDELIDALTTDHDQAVKILADVNRQRKTDSGNKVRSSLKAKDSESATKKAFTISFETMLAAKGLKIADLLNKTSEEIAALLA
jgi:hypothetical protein